MGAGLLRHGPAAFHLVGHGDRGASGESAVLDVLPVALCVSVGLAGRGGAEGGRRPGMVCAGGREVRCGGGSVAGLDSPVGGFAGPGGGAWRVGACPAGARAAIRAERGGDAHGGDAEVVRGPDSMGVLGRCDVRVSGGVQGPAGARGVVVQAAARGGVYGLRRAGGVAEV